MRRSFFAFFPFYHTHSRLVNTALAICGCSPAHTYSRRNLFTLPLPEPPTPLCPLYKKRLPFTRQFDIILKLTNKYGQLTQLGECLLDVEKVTGSSPVLPTNPNLKRTPFRFRFFLLSLRCRNCVLLSRRNAVVGSCAVVSGILSVKHKRRFMPRKPLDVRKERVRLFAKGKPKPTEIYLGGLRVLPLFAYTHAPARLTSSGTWNK